MAQLDERAALSGACEGATHYVRGIYRGAFAMETSTRGQARTAAEVLGMGASASVQGTHRMRIAAGVPAACELVRPESSTPPEGCDIPLRLELRLLAQLHEAEPASPRPRSDCGGRTTHFHSFAATQPKE